MILRGRSCPLANHRNRRRAALRAAQALVGGELPLLLLGTPESDIATSLQTQVGGRRQDPWFDWLCGCHEPGAALLIEGAGRSTLFLDPGRPERVVWDGPRLAPGRAAARAFGVQDCLPVTGLRAAVEQAAAAAGHRLGMFSREREPGFQAQQFPLWKRRLRGIALVNVEPAVLLLRMRKDPAEIALHRRAVRRTWAGLKAALQALPRARGEAEIAGILMRHYLAEGFEAPAFAPIVGSAVNAATLHYPHNDQPLVRRACVLIDSGARSGGYCADVTRTVPQHGRFTDRRFRELYEIVLRAQQLGIRHARPGITLKEWNEVAWRPITDAGLVRHHGLGHHLGLDVHDPADLEAPLEPGMLITCEPGVYLAEEGIGIRIEDNLLITARGNENTTRMIPKSIAALERLMA